jgi:hypothetical protein
MANKRKKEDIAEKLSALRPSVPTSTRAKAARKKPPQKAGKPVIAPAPKAKEKKPALPKKEFKTKTKAEARPAIQTAAKEKNTAVPKKETKAEARPTIQVAAPTKAALPGMEVFGTQIEKSLRLPWMMFDLWKGFAQAYYGLAESQVNFLVNMASWRVRF